MFFQDEFKLVSSIATVHISSTLTLKTCAAKIGDETGREFNSFLDSDFETSTAEKLSYIWLHKDIKSVS